MQTSFYISVISEILKILILWSLKKKQIRLVVVGLQAHFEEFWKEVASARPWSSKMWAVELGVSVLQCSRAFLSFGWLEEWKRGETEICMCIQDFFGPLSVLLSGNLVCQSILVCRRLSLIICYKKLGDKKSMILWLVSGIVDLYTINDNWWTLINLLTSLLPFLYWSCRSTHIHPSCTIIIYFGVVLLLSS